MNIWQFIALGTVIFYGIGLYILIKYGTRITRRLFR